MYISVKPYGVETYTKQTGVSTNEYRGEDFGQPKTLHPGDVLATGRKIAKFPSEAVGGRVRLSFDVGEDWIVDPRIPVALVSDKQVTLARELQAGYVLETSCTVLSTPNQLNESSGDYLKGSHETIVHLTAAIKGRLVGVPNEFPVALHSVNYPPNPESIIGQMAIDRVMRLDDGIRSNLQNLGQPAAQHL